MNTESTFVTVRSQHELDAALADAAVDRVIIDSPKGVRIRITSDGGKLIWVTGEARIDRVGGSARVDRVDGSARIDWVDGSAYIDWVGGSARISRVGGSARISRMDGLARIDRVDGSARIDRASGVSVIHGVHGGTVNATSPFTTIYLYSGDATVTGGNVVDLREIDQSDPDIWCAMQGVDVADGHAVVFKAVNADLFSEHGTEYPIGQTATATDWRDDDSCGGGLHFGPTPRHARDYADRASRFLACRVPMSALRGITDGATAKCKAQSCEVLHEVDLDGARLVAEEVPA